MMKYSLLFGVKRSLASGLSALASLFSLALLSLMLSGCSDTTQVVKLRLTYQGSDYIPASGEYLLVILIPADTAVQDTFPANPMPDGTFAVVAGGKGIPPGKYHVKIENPMRNGRVQIPEEYSRTDSPLIREVILGKEQLDPVELSRDPPAS